MSTIYELNIPFRPSKDYQRLVCVLYGLGLASVWWYAYPFWVSTYLSVAILVHGLHLFRLAKPYRHYYALSFVGKHWYLTDALGLKTAFSQLRVAYDFGFIFCIALQAKDRQRYVLFFRDQLTAEERRTFYFSQLEWREPIVMLKPIEKEPSE